MEIGDEAMAVFTKPIHIAFELNHEKAEKFLQRTGKSTGQQAIERASLHRKDLKKDMQR